MSVGDRSSLLERLRIASRRFDSVSCDLCAEALEALEAATKRCACDGCDRPALGVCADHWAAFRGTMARHRATIRAEQASGGEASTLGLLDIPIGHALKTHPEPFQAIWDGLKRFEVRRDDRRFEAGQHLHLREWSPETEAYSARWILATVAYLVRGPAWGLPEGLVVMSIGQVVRHQSGYPEGLER